MTAALLAKSTVPLMIAVVPTLLEVAAICVAPDRVSTPPVVTVGVAVPPILLKVRPVREFAPTKVSVLPPLSVTACEPITPPVVCVTVPLLMARPPAGSVPVAPMFRVSALTTVPPV